MRLGLRVFVHSGSTYRLEDGKNANYSDIFVDVNTRIEVLFSQSTEYRAERRREVGEEGKDEAAWGFSPKRLIKGFANDDNNNRTSVIDFVTAVPQ